MSAAYSPSYLHSMEELTVVHRWPRNTGTADTGLPRTLVPFQRPNHSRWNESWQFLSNFVRHPFTVGAVAPSSQQLAEAMIRRSNLKSARTVVEFGAGTGAITQLIAERANPHATFLAFELNADYVRRLRQRFTDVRICFDSAGNLRSHLDRLGLKHADCIISGLPFATMSNSIRQQILRAVIDSLKPGGVFSIMAYLHASWYPASRRLRRELREHFSSVTTSPVIWPNVPPAFVYYCR